MIRNSLKIVLRNFIKKPTFSIINVLGLAIGLACFVLTMVYVNYELSYGSFHKDKGRIHLVTSTISYGDYFKENNALTSQALAEELRTNFPEVKSASGVFGSFNFVFEQGKNLYREKNIYFVDSTFFDVFTYDFIEGSPEDALVEINSMVITESIAKKYFGDEKAYGKLLSTVNDNYKITGVIRNPPKNSVIRIDMLISMGSIYINLAPRTTKWQSNNCKTYIVLQEGVDTKQLESKFPTLIKSKIPQIQGQDIERWLATGNRWEYHLFSLKEVYLNLEGNGIYVFGFGLVAMFLLTIACINYMNLSTAKASTRAKEVGVRLSVGAFRMDLIRQFLSESMLMSFLSLIIGMGLVEAVLPVLSKFIEKDLGIHYFDNLLVLPIIIILGVSIGFLSGIYPAFVLSSFKPVEVLKGQRVGNHKGLNLRSILVFIQFTISVFLIISLLVVEKQSNLLYTKDLGYDKENLLVIKNIGPSKTSIRDRKDFFKADLLRIPGVESVSATRDATSEFGYPSKPWTARDGETKLMAETTVDPDYFKTLKLQMLTGRFFHRDYSTDSSAIVINETAAKLLNWKDPLSLKLSNGKDECQVIGVVKDFNFQPLHHKIEPLLMLYNGGGIVNDGPSYFMVRFDPKTIQSTITSIEKLWGEYVPNAPCEFYISSERDKSYYKKEVQTSQLMLFLTLLVIFVTLIGLYGLASFSVEEKMKEIAIRKAIGASVTSIIYKMTWNFTKLVLIANIVAWPLAWYFMNDWLSGFATRINISWWIFVLAALLSYLLAIATIIFQAFSAARRNPVEVLRYE